MGWRRLPGLVIAGLVCHSLYLSGCGQSLRLTRLAAVARPPSNVAVFFALGDAHGEPVADLGVEDFRVFEDGRLVSRAESQQRLIDPAVAAAHYTMLLVDMSATVMASDQLALISAAAREFVAELERAQHVGVFAFDGSKSLYEIVPFTAPGGGASAAVDRLRSFQSKDPSTNLNGAVLSALSELDRAVRRSDAPLRFGSLVVFTDGTDRASRVPYQQMIDAVEASPHDLYTLGVGREIDDSTLARIGRAGYVRVEDSSAARSAFHQVAARIQRVARGYYLLSYCSPARAGRHALMLEAQSATQRGQLDYVFDASGFGARCDASQPPPFTGAALPP